MTIIDAGTVVQFNVSDRPYQQWHGDTAECSRCGARVTDRFGSRPTWEHYNDAGDAREPNVIVPDKPKQTPVNVSAGILPPLPPGYVVSEIIVKLPSGRYAWVRDGARVTDTADAGRDDDELMILTDAFLI